MNHHAMAILNRSYGELCSTWASCFIYLYHCVYVGAELSQQLKRTNIGRVYVQSIGTCIYFYVYVVMKL